MKESDKMDKIVFVMDFCGCEFFDFIELVLDELDNINFIIMKIFFLEVDDKVFVLCYKEMCCYYLLEFNGFVLDGINVECELFSDLKGCL